MKQNTPKHVVDLSKPGTWAFVASSFLFMVCTGSILVAIGKAGGGQEVFAGLLYCGGMLALIASILLFDRYRRETTS